MSKGARFAAVVFTMMALLASASVFAGQDAREARGRALFAKGEYQAALDIYADLFAEKGEALYLRNIGRCYQKLERPRKSIDAFREYLRRARIKPAERAEVEGFIEEMEAMEKMQAVAAATEPPPPQPAPPPVAPAPPPPAVAVTPAPVTGAPGATLSTAQEPVPSEQPERPITHQWWFWTGLGALLAGGAVTAIVIGRSGSGMGFPPCPSGTVCPH